MTQIYGIVPPATTPFDADGNVDSALLTENLRFLIETAGVHGLAVCGSTGEGHTLTTDETRPSKASHNPLSGLGSRRSGTMVRATPKPSQRPQAPSWLLNEKCRGVSSDSTTTPWVSQVGRSDQRRIIASDRAQNQA